MRKLLSVTLMTLAVAAWGSADRRAEAASYAGSASTRCLPSPQASPQGDPCGHVEYQLQRQIVLKPVQETIYESQQVTTLRDVCETVMQSRQVTEMRSVSETCYRQVPYTVQRPSYRTVFRECRYTVQRPVSRTIWKTCSYTVCNRPVRETHLETKSYTVCRPVRETSYKTSRVYTVCRPGPRDVATRRAPTPSAGRSRRPYIKTVPVHGLPVGPGHRHEDGLLDGQPAGGEDLLPEAGRDD